MSNRPLISDQEESDLNRLFTHVKLGTILKRLAEAIVATHKEMDESRDLAKQDWHELSDKLKTNQ